MIQNILTELWNWLPKWQIWFLLGAVVVLGFLGKGRLAALAFLVVLFAWVMGFMVSVKQIFTQLNAMNILIFAVVSLAFGLVIIWAAVYRRD